MGNVGCQNGWIESFREFDHLSMGLSPVRRGRPVGNLCEYRQVQATIKYIHSSRFWISSLVSSSPNQTNKSSITRVTTKQ